jgi:hypothetical protein
MTTTIRRGVWMTTAVVLTVAVLTATANAAPPRFRGGFPGKPVRPGFAPINTFNANPYAVAPAYTLPTPQIPINPNYYVSPGLTVGQAAYNQALANYGTYANTPYANYNPYVTSYNYGPVYPTYTPAYSNYNPYYNPYGVYGGGYGY